MAEKIVSPGVFTNERDLSFLPTGIASIGAVVMGPTTKGPAFVPTVITNFEDFKAKFGDLNESTYIPYTVKSYLRNASNVIVVRVVQEGGYTTTPNHLVWTSGGTKRIVGTIHPSLKSTTSIAGGGANLAAFQDTVTSGLASVTGSFKITLSGSADTPGSTFSASAQPTSPISLEKVIGTTVYSNKSGFLYTWHRDFLGSQVGLSGSLTIESHSLDLSGTTYGAAQKGATPYITTQKLDGQVPQKLFRFLANGQGQDTNTAYKISIINTLLPGDDPASAYGTFTVLVRAYDDTDQRPNVLETFVGCNLDPDSVNYISRKIGDRYVQVNSDNTITYKGNYDNRSKYIYVEVTDDVANKGVPPTYRPYGFEPLLQTVSGSTSMPFYNLIENATYTNVLTGSMAQTIINGFYNAKAYYGWNFAAYDNANYLKPIPAMTTAPTDARGLSGYFNLDYCFIHPSASKKDTRSVMAAGTSISGSTLKGVDISNVAKFNVPFQGGFEGLDIAKKKLVGSEMSATNVCGFDCSTSTTSGSQAYFKALGIIGNGEEFDINLIVTPGPNAAQHPAVIQKAIEVAEDRGDTFVIVDPVKQGSQIGDAVGAITDASLDSNYAACYWPWVKIIDITRNKPVWVPPSAVLPGVLAYNDSVSFEWFAPAGLNRGGISEAVDVESKLTFSQRDLLYENRINPLATFPNQGVCVWGQKTLQSKPSALDRINVRRLMIALKKYIASATRYLVFENNTTETRQRFLNIVNPYLERVKSRQGLYAFRVVMDETNNTPDVIDRNQMYGQIFLQPARSSEFIILDFNILPTGASFENA
jgi:hypothetical protein